jgi:hypothetical protein
MATESDNFNRTNENPLSDGGNWATCSGLDDLELESNVVHGERNNQDCFMYRTTQFNTDHYTQATRGGNANHQPMTRCDNADTDDFYCYFISADTSMFFYRVDDGSFTQVGSESNPGLSGGEVTKMISSGNTHSIEFDDSEADSQSDSTHSDHTLVGLGMYDNNTDETWDDWSGGDLVAGDLTADVTEAPSAADAITSATGDFEVSVADCPKPIDKLK